MKKEFLKLSFMFFLLTLFSVSCTDKVDNPYLTVSPEEIINLKNSGGSVTLNIDANVDWEWELEEQEWITAEAASSGLVLEVTSNSEAERRAVLKITSSKFPMVNKMLTVIQGATYLNISPKAIEVPGEGAEIVVTVDTSVDDWTFSLENGSWLTVEKTESGLLIKAPFNRTPQIRTATLNITSADFPNVDREIPLSQISSIKIEPHVSEYTFSTDGGEATIEIETNLDDWDFKVNDEWLTAEKTETGLILTAGSNYTETELSTILTVYATEFPDDIWEQIEVGQNSAVVFFDNFDWLGAGASPIAYTATGEKRFDSWEATYGTLNGWTSTPAPDAGGGVQPWVYSRLNYAKFGKTACSGDMISPKMPNIEGTRNVVVSFKAFCYISAGAGAVDDNDFNVEIIGPGEVTEIIKEGSQPFVVEGKVASSGQILDSKSMLFMIGNYNNTDGPNRSIYFGVDYEPFDPQYSERSFAVSGVTSETQFRFIGGPKIGVTETTFRFGFDDVKVVLTP